MLKRIIVASSVAILLALPAVFEAAWHVQAWAPLAILLLNFPGIFCGFLFGGRFFPPEGYIGQSATRTILMVLVQAVVWYAVLSLLHRITMRRKKAPSHATRSI